MAVDAAAELNEVSAARELSARDRLCPRHLAGERQQQQCKG